MAKRSKTADVAVDTSKPVVKPSIPLAVRPAAADGLDLLAQLTGAATTKPKAKAKKVRPELKLTPEAAETFQKFAPAKELFDIFEEHKKAVGGDLNKMLFEAYLDLLWHNKSQPENPTINAGDCTGMMVVQEKFKLQIPDDTNPKASMIEFLKNAGVVKAEELMEEVDFTPQTTLRAFNELVSGHYEDKQFIEATAAEKALGTKILNLIMTNLTAEEKAAVLIRTPKTVVTKGFLNRVTTYANSREQLATILSVIEPVNYPKGATCAVGATPVDKTKQLVAHAAEILGSAEFEDEDDE